MDNPVVKAVYDYIKYLHDEHDICLNINKLRDIGNIIGIWWEVKNFVSYYPGITFNELFERMLRENGYIEE